MIKGKKPLEKSLVTYYKAWFWFMWERFVVTTVIEAVTGLWCRILIGHFTPISIAVLSYQPLIKLIGVNWFIAYGFLVSGYLLRNRRFSVRLAGRGCLLVCGIVTVLMTLHQVCSIYHVNLWQSALAVFLMALVLWFFMIGALSQEPSLVRAAFQWRKIDSKNITLFYLEPNSKVEMILLLQNCNEVLNELTVALNVETKLPNIPVFLFNDPESFRGWNKVQAEKYNALAFGDSIHIVNGTWKRLGRTVAHELTHIVSCQCYTGRNSVKLLEEGLAECMEREVFPKAYLVGPAPLVKQPFSEPSPTPVLRQPLSELAGQPFIDLRGDPNESHKAYYHAHALVHYLICNRGLSSFLQAHRIASNKEIDDCETRLRLAVQEVYHETLEELEEKWRSGCSISDEGELVVPDIYSQTAIEAIRAAEFLARQLGSAFVETSHLMGGLLAQKRSIAWNVLLFSIAEIPDELFALHCVETKTDPTTYLPDEAKPKWSMSARQAINYAFFEARQFGCTYLGTEHLLLGVMRELEATDAPTLASYGITPQEFREYAIAFYKDHRPRE